MIHRLNPPIASLLVALAYFVTGRLGLMLPAFGTSITLIWLPTGIAVAALLRFGFGCWPGVALGAAAVNFAVGTPLAVALAIAVGNTLGPLLAAWALRRIGFHPAFARKRDIFFLSAAAILGMLVSASLGTASLSLAGRLWEGRIAAWLIWWAGDTMGVIIAAPLVFAFTRKGVRAIGSRHAEFIAWLCATGLVAWIVFVQNQDSNGRAWSLAFMPLPLVAWAALRYGPVGTSVALIVMSVIAAYGTATGRGPFYRPAPIEDVTVLWIFMATAALLGWLITALQAARVHATGIRQLLDQALTDVSLGVLLAGLDRRVTFANEGFARLTGYTEAEMLGKSCSLLHGPDTDPATVQALRAALNGDGYFDGEILNYRKDGTAFWNALLISPVHDERGVKTGFLGILRDITRRKETELALHQSEEHLRTIVELEPECVKLLSPEGKLIDMNPAGLAMIGARSLDEIRGRLMSDFIVPEDRARFFVMHRRALNGETVRCEFSMQGLCGTLRRVETNVVPYRDVRREIIGVLGITRDITKRKQAEEALREREERLRVALAASGTGTFRWDIRSNVLTWDEALDSLFGLPPGMTTRSLENFVAAVHPDDRLAVVELCERCALDGADFEMEFRVVRPDGSVRWLDDRGKTFLDAAGRPLHMTGACVDITARKQAEFEREKLDRKVQETQKLESLGVLAGGIAHDFNNLLTTILGNASLGAMDLPASSPVQECLTQIIEASHRAADLCKQMLAYSGRGRFVVQTLDLGQLLEDTAQMLRISISKKAVLRFRLEKDLPSVEVDATQIRQIIMNLVINASEAIGDKSGVICISTGLTRVDRGYLAATFLDPSLPEGEYVFIEVSDNGSGMSAETQAKIFDPFYTTKFTGRGLGLAAVLGIVRGHKGAMKVYSELCRGSTFKLLFPAVRDVSETPAAMLAAMPAGAATWRGNGTVLVVDDEETMRSTVARMLRHLGLDPVLVADGREAVEIFRATPSRFALVLLDLSMPHMDGEQTFAELRRLRPDVRVVLMSGFNAQEAMVRFTGKGLASFVQKPFAVGELRTVLHDILG